MPREHGCSLHNKCGHCGMKCHSNEKRKWFRCRRVALGNVIESRAILIRPPRVHGFLSPPAQGDGRKSVRERWRHGGMAMEGHRRAGEPRRERFTARRKWVSDVHAKESGIFSLGRMSSREVNVNRHVAVISEWSSDNKEVRGLEGRGKLGTGKPIRRQLPLSRKMMLCQHKGPLPKIIC